MGDDVEQLTIGSRYLVVGGRTVPSAPPGLLPIELTNGTTLEVATLDESWDNTHAMIFRTAFITADLRVVDDPRAGEIVRITFSEEVVGDLGRHSRTGWPVWLRTTR
jgi:hypothetical protein